MDLIASSPRRTSMMVGAFIALVFVVGYSLIGLVGALNVAAPYLAGTAMFVTLLAIFGGIIGMLKKVRKGAQKQVAMRDCYIAAAVIGVAGFFLAACVQTFMPGANPATLWTHGAVTAAIFVALFGGSGYLADLFNAGGKAK